MPHVQSMLFATDQIGMSILMDPNLAHSVMFDSQPYGSYEDPVGFSACYPDYTKAVSETQAIYIPRYIYIVLYISSIPTYLGYLDMEAGPPSPNHILTSSACSSQNRSTARLAWPV